MLKKKNETLFDDIVILHDDIEVIFEYAIAAGTNEQGHNKFMLKLLQQASGGMALK